MNPDTWNIVSSLSSAIAAAAAAAGLLYVAIQIRHSHRTAMADLVLRLEENFADHHYSTYPKFCEGGAFCRDQASPLEKSEILEIEHYLDYFATLRLLTQLNLIPLATIDRIFAHRFFCATNNDHSQAVIFPKADYWADLKALHESWSQFRRKKGLPIPHPDKDMNLIPQTCATIKSRVPAERGANKAVNPSGGSGEF